MKTNFRKESEPIEPNYKHVINNHAVPEKKLTKDEFEDWVIKSGAKGSFMVYRSEKKEDELGIDLI